MAKSTKTKKAAGAPAPTPKVAHRLRAKAKKAPPPSTKAARLLRTKTAIDQQKHKPRLSKGGKAKRKQMREALRAARVSCLIDKKIEGFTGIMPKLVVPYLIAESRSRNESDKPMMYSEGSRHLLRLMGGQMLGELARDCAMVLHNKNSRMLQPRDVYTASRISGVLAGASCMDPMNDVQATTPLHRFARLRDALAPSPTAAAANVSTVATVTITADA